MSKLVWDAVGTREYEAGVDCGVLYIPDSEGVYSNGVAWNGLTKLTEAPSGASANAQFADNVKYLNLLSAEQFGGTLEAFTYPDEFAQFDGLGVPTPGVMVGQQSRKTFGLSYRTLLGNDVDSTEFGEKMHLMYGCQASPSQKDYVTINDSPAAINLSWAITTTPVGVTGMKPTSLLVVDSTKVNATVYAALKTILYGDTGVDPRLPLPDEVITMFEGGVTVVTPTVPTYNNGTHTLTIPSVTGVQYFNHDVLVTAGDHVIGADAFVQARTTAGHIFASGVDTDWFFDFS